MKIFIKSLFTMEFTDFTTYCYRSMFQTLLALKWIFREKKLSYVSLLIKVLSCRAEPATLAKKEAHVGSFWRSAENSGQSAVKLLFTKNAGLKTMTAIWLKLGSTKNVYIWMWILMSMLPMSKFPNSHHFITTKKQD